MNEKSDVQLLRDYAENGNEAAFSEIVARYTDLVYSAALRQLNASDQAADITQKVFGDLARKAKSVAGRHGGNGNPDHHSKDRSGRLIGSALVGRPTR